MTITEKLVLMDSMDRRYRENVRCMLKGAHDMEEQILAYLKERLTAWIIDRDLYGVDDRVVRKDLDRLLACKDMAEVLICKPINLTVNGNVTVGY